MISNYRKSIFIDISKVAGTSISESLHSLDDTFYGKHHNLKNIGSNQYCINFLTEAQINNYYKFTFVRNPFDRLVSLWLWGYTRTDFNKWVSDIGTKYKHNAFENIIEYMRIMPMHEWIEDKNGNRKVDFIGRYERLGHDFRLVCDHFRFPRVTLKKVYTAKERTGKPRKPYQEYYDEKSIKIVTEIYKRDLIEFNYSFEPRK